MASGSNSKFVKTKIHPPSGIAPPDKGAKSLYESIQDNRIQQIRFDFYFAQRLDMSSKFSISSKSGTQQQQAPQSPGQNVVYKSLKKVSIFINIKGWQDDNEAQRTVTFCAASLDTGGLTEEGRLCRNDLQHSNKTPGGLCISYVGHVLCLLYYI